MQPPIDCPLGEDQRCFIQQYVDRDSGPGATDYRCETLSYDGHKGTDFALRSLDEVAKGVPVIAAAPGRVRATRDGLPDQLLTAQNEHQIEGKECGNGVVITHENGWETQYCHLRRGSITVRNGQTVDAGTQIGLVGLSGRTQFPHVHLSVRKDGQPIDPFAPDATSCSITRPAEDLWIKTPDYQPGGIISAGFSTQIPDYDAVKQGRAGIDELRLDSPALVLWGHVFGSRPGDTLRLSITGPDGATVIEKDLALEKAQAQLFRAIGRKTGGASWFGPGQYRGDVALIRDGTVISDTTIQLQVAR
ncbi:M23 family metallopeptidase [Aliishimia ponticola]|uniref:M23 family metallopeptidase n=1 Tax=Aliishimia ponticola TaxID=2499833 RepID=UPI001FE8BA43|nr:M23 family metallopeptidase [Aliishimia ponticola]